MPTETFASDSVTKLLERFAFQVNHTVHTSDPDSLHDLRVATRRFAQSLYLFKAAFAGKEVKKIRGRLKDLMELTNAPRDCDVVLKLLPKSELPGVDPLLEAVTARRKQALRALIPALRRWGARETSSKWRAALFANGENQDPFAETVRERLGDQIKRVLKEGGHARSPHALHRARIAGKKLRYSFELLQPVYGERLTQAVTDIKIMQTLLGDMNDCVAAADLVRELGGDQDIESWLKKRQKKKVREFRDEWPAIKDSLGVALALVRHPEPKPAVLRAS